MHIHRRAGQVNIHVAVMLVFALIVAFIFADGIPCAGFHL